MMCRYEKLTLEDIRLIHEDMLEAFGGRAGEHEPGLIEYMSEKPFQELFGQERYPGLFMKAAVYMHSFSTTQLFQDGNKRTGYGCAFAFLKLNRYTIIVDDESLFITAIAIATKKMSLEELAQWLENNSVLNDLIEEI